MHTIVALLVLAVGLAATLYYWKNLQHSVQSEMDAAFNKQTRSIAQALQNRVHLYENILRGSAGLFAIHTGLTQDTWETYHKPYNIGQSYTDIQGVGVSRYLHKDELPAYLERRYAQGDTDFKITPAGERDVYVPVTFNVPYTGNNGKARGYDGYADPTRRRAMLHAIDTGELAISGTVQLFSETRKPRSSFIMYFPVYAQGKPTTTVQERQAAILAFSYLTIDIKAFLDGILTMNQNPNMALQIYDGDKTTPSYQSSNFTSVVAQRGTKVRTSRTEVSGHTWKVTFAASPNLISARQRQLPQQALWRGIITCIFFSGLVWYLITDRERKYARQKQEEVQTAKDDLLSLASHQLRTPATVVKQYVGMLLQGYAGKVSPQQQEMLNNAYDSNERQLEIINQLLYVARLDAGRITLHPKSVDLIELWQGVIRDQEETFVARSQKVVSHFPDRPLKAEVDPHYLRMVLENLLSNAIKYTPEGGTITLDLSKSGNKIIMKVSDTGVGIVSGMQSNIFEKFTRVENELSTDVNGSGVGLYLTKQIVELHGGTIAVTSTPGEGSQFTVRIPAKRLLPPGLPFISKDSH